MPLKTLTPKPEPLKPEPPKVESPKPPLPQKKVLDVDPLSWKLEIEGIGVRNSGSIRDADSMCYNFTQELKNAGHGIFKATFSHPNGDEDLKSRLK